MNPLLREAAGAVQAGWILSAMTVVFFAIGTDWERLFAAAVGPLEVATPTRTIFANTPERRAEAARTLRAAC